jgi:hypothetical protein
LASLSEDCVLVVSRGLVRGGDLHQGEMERTEVTRVGRTYSEVTMLSRCIVRHRCRQSCFEVVVELWVGGAIIKLEFEDDGVRYSLKGASNSAHGYTMSSLWDVKVKMRSF